MTGLQHLDIEALEELRDVMEDEFDCLIETFITDADKKLVALKAAIEANDPSEIGKVSHSFKGSCSNIGAPYLSDLCKISEDKGRNEDTTDIDVLYEQIKDEYHQVKNLLSEQLSQ
ncbi:Hpt domain-containing protein [Litoribrevibacter albus]|uniref:Sensor histidine kinase n=1 Tax=Litoribrevibacter albus TaxID=1473156 RepID=A0AA37SD70_9GAMM|nr:Hpt domain-containing protein [Litoribrevibacter albus]GLQ32342.1 sensor histidine kinase [Litoribrevibacter albus]